MFLPGGASKKRSTGQRRVTSWLQKRIAAFESCQVIATEVQCNEPDCVPIETMIVLVSTVKDGDEKPWRWTGKILMPIEDVKEEDVQKLQIEFPSKVATVSDATKDVAVDDTTQADAVDDVKIPPKPFSGFVGKTAPKSVFSLGTPAKDGEETQAKHKGIRPRGCPCCDPEDLDNLLDNMMFGGSI